MTEIRPIRAEDEDAWRRLWGAYHDFYAATVPEAVRASSFARLVDPAVTDYRGLLAWRDGRPIGLAHVIFHRHGWRIEDVCYLQDLFVDPSARGSGAGRALIEAVYAMADANGTPRVYWLTQEFNSKARALYDRVGRATPFIKYER
jgi:GNAT superfamily N-acetyltransferase